MKRSRTWKVIYFFQSLFLSGFFAIFPLTVTIAAITFFYSLCKSLLAPIRSIEPEILQSIPGSEFILVVAAVLIIGILVNYVVVQPLIHKIEYIFSKIPFINSIHSALHAVISFFKTQEDLPEEERKVILLPFSEPNLYHIAFSIGSNRGYEKYSTNPEPLIKVFVPTSPVPGHGFFLIVPRTSIIETKLSFEEAMKIIVSCGLISPELLS